MTTAILTNKREQPNDNGLCVVDVDCPKCRRFETLTFDGWDAVLCPGCGEELNHPDYALEASLEESLEDLHVELDKAAKLGVLIADLREFVGDYDLEQSSCNPGYRIKCAAWYFAEKLEDGPSGMDGTTNRLVEMFREMYQ